MSTQEKENIITTAERIVIDYADCSGREDINRSAFRGMVVGHLNTFLSATLIELVAEMEGKKIIESKKPWLDKLGRVNLTPTEQQNRIEERGYNQAIEGIQSLIRNKIKNI